MEMSVLFVDDEIHILNSLNRLLRKEPYTVITASSGEEGLEILRKHDVSVIVSDYRMPKMTGVEFLNQAKKIRKDAIRIILSGYADSKVILDAINKGEVYRFFTKPWDEIKLIESIRQSLLHFKFVEEHRSMFSQMNLKNIYLENLIKKSDQNMKVVQDILAHIPVPLIELSNDGHLILANQIFRNVYFDQMEFPIGIKIEKVLPNDWVNFILNCQREKTRDTYKTTFKGEDLYLEHVSLDVEDNFRGSLIFFHGRLG